MHKQSAFRRHKDTIAVNTIVKNKAGGVSFCDILYVEDLDVFNERYLKWADFGKSAKGD